MSAEMVAPANARIPAWDRGRRVLAALPAMARRALRFRLRCLVLGHDDSFAREPHRLMLRCERCGRETAGWAIGGGVDVAAARRVSPGRRTARDTTVRVGPWALRRREGRGEARDRQRRRLVAAAARLGGR